MSWSRLDDGFFAHPKVIDLSKDAKLLFLAGLTHCSANLTGGKITLGALRTIAALVDVNQKRSAELVAVGLWEAQSDGFLVHDYEDYNPSVGDVKKKREQNAKRQKAWRDKHRDNRNHSGISNSSNNGSSNAVTNDPYNTHPIVTKVTDNAEGIQDAAPVVGAMPSLGGEELDPYDPIPAAKTKPLPPKSKSESDAIILARADAEFPHWRVDLEARATKAGAEKRDAYMAAIARDWFANRDKAPKPPEPTFDVSRLVVYRTPEGTLKTDRPPAGHDMESFRRLLESQGCMVAH